MATERERNYQALQQQLRQLGQVAVAFSGGVDSTFLLKVAHDLLGDRAVAITAASPAVPRRELEQAAAFCRREGIRQLIYEADLLNTPAFRDNPPDRCYHCKKALFTGMGALAEEAGFPTLAEGSNVDDTGDYRPGMTAIRELGVVSPLLTAGLTKADIRALSRQLDLPTWDHPSAACLASRICYGEPITLEKLSLVEQAEDFLTGLGLGQLRVRLHGALARIEVLPEQFPLVLAHRQAITSALQNFGCSYVSLDLTGYRTGSLNETLSRDGGETPWKKVDNAPSAGL